MFDKDFGDFLLKLNFYMLGLLYMYRIYITIYLSLKQSDC